MYILIFFFIKASSFCLLSLESDIIEQRIRMFLSVQMSYSEYRENSPHMWTTFGGLPDWQRNRSPWVMFLCTSEAVQCPFSPSCFMVQEQMARKHGPAFLSQQSLSTAQVTYPPQCLVQSLNSRSEIWHEDIKKWLVLMFNSVGN